MTAFPGFTADTVVSTEGGSLPLIALRPGDRVLHWDHGAMCKRPCLVSKVRMVDPELIEVVQARDFSVRCSLGARFWCVTRRQFAKVAKYKDHMALLVDGTMGMTIAEWDYNNRTHKIIQAPVWHLEIERIGDPHEGFRPDCFFANGLLVQAYQP